MKIRWIGHSAFYIETAKGLRIRTDPYDKSVGLPMSSLPADVVTISHEHYDHNAAKSVPGNPTILKGPQDTVVGDAAFKSIPTFHDDAQGTERGANTVFLIAADGVTLVHLGDLGQMLAHSQIDALGDIDVLCVPVGGVYTIDADGAYELMEELAPAVTIPMHYRIPGLNVKIETVDAFLHDKPRVRNADELDLNLKNLPDAPEIVVLKPRP